MTDPGFEPAGDGRGRERDTSAKAPEAADRTDERDEAEARRTQQTEEQLARQRATAAAHRQRDERLSGNDERTR